MVYDIFDCTFECLQTPSCLSINLAVNEGADGKLLCELLSSDIYRSYMEFKSNGTSHHFSIMVRHYFFFSICKEDTLRDDVLHIFS